MKKMKKDSQATNQAESKKEFQLDYTVEEEEKSILFEKEIRELFELCMQAMQVTDYVAFEINNYTKYAVVTIEDKGFGESFSGQCYYAIHFDNEMVFGKTSQRAYQEAKEHLLRILEVAK